MKAFIFKASKEFVSTLEIDSTELLPENLSQIQAQFQLAPGDYIETSHQTFTFEKLDPPTGLPPENPPDTAMASDGKSKTASHTIDLNPFVLPAIAGIGLLILIAIAIFAPLPTPTAPVEHGYIPPEISSEVNLFVQTEIGKYFPRIGSNRISKYVYKSTEKYPSYSPPYLVKELVEWKDPSINISRLQISEVDSLNGTTELYEGKWTIRFFRQWENDSQWSEWKPFETLKTEPSKPIFSHTAGRHEFYTTPPNFIVRKKDSKLLIEWITREDPSTHTYYPEKYLDFQNDGDEDRTRESILPK